MTTYDNMRLKRSQLLEHCRGLAKNLQVFIEDVESGLPLPDLTPFSNGYTDNFQTIIELHSCIRGMMIGASAAKPVAV